MAIKVTLARVPFSRYHQRILSDALYNCKPKTQDRDVMDAWVNMCSAVGEAIAAQEEHFIRDKWMDRCYYGVER